MRRRAPRSAAGLRLLVVEPSEDAFVSTLDMLSGSRGASYSVDWVTSAEAARRRIPRDHYDFILVDHALGRMASLDLVRFCAERAADARTVILAEERDPELAADARLAGADAFLVKQESGGAALERAIRAATGAPPPPDLTSQLVDLKP